MRSLTLTIGTTLVAGLAACHQAPRWWEPKQIDPDAIRDRQIAETRAFLTEVEAGHDIDEPSFNGATRLQALCAFPDTAPEPVRMLVDAGADINARTPSANTPLMLASTAGWRHTHGISRPHDWAAEVVDVLVERGADVNATDDQGRTALALCALRGDPERIRVLVDAGTDVDARDDTGRTPLMWAAPAQPRNVEALLDLGADPNLLDDRGWSALVWMVRGTLYRDLDEEALQALLDAGADMESADADGWTPVMHAAYAGRDYEAVEFLLEAGASPAPAGWSETTLLMLTRTVRPFELRLRDAPDLESRDAWGRTALMWSARFGWRKYFRGSNQSIGWNPTALLLGAGADISAQDDQGMTATHIAAGHSRTALCTLIKAGADLEIRDDQGRTPLLAAIEMPYYTSNVGILLDAGADPDARDDAGRTALMVASTNPYAHWLIESLLEAGADPTLTDSDGRTALDYATSARGLRDKDRANALLDAARKAAEPR